MRVLSYLHTHTHTHVPIWNVHSMYMEYTCSTHSHTHVPLLSLCLCQHISLFCFCFFCSPSSTYTPLPLYPSLSVIPTRFLAISHYRTRFVCFVFFLFAMKNKYVSGSHRIIVCLCHEIQRRLNKHPSAYSLSPSSSPCPTPCKGYLVPLFLKCLINGPLFALKKLFVYCVKLQLKWASTLAMDTEEGDSSSE